MHDVLSLLLYKNEDMIHYMYTQCIISSFFGYSLYMRISRYDDS